MRTILLSIKPKYSKLIFDGSKKFEFRKIIAKKEVDKIIVYSSSPDKVIIGEVYVTGIVSMKKKNLWEFTKKHAGITEDEFFSYFDKNEVGYAYKLGKVEKYKNPKQLKDLGVEKAPQSFIYLDL